MAQAVLTNAIKEQIVNNALAKAGIDKRKATLRSARADWAERIRVKALGGSEAEAEILKNLKKIKALAAKFPQEIQVDHWPVKEGRYQYTNLAGCRVYAFFNGNYKEYEHGPDHEVRIVSRELILTAEDPLVTEFHGFDALYKQIKGDEDSIRQNVNAALSKVRTVKKLLEAWPEAKELLPADAPAVPLPPAIRREALNEMIGLPSDEETV